MKQAVLDAATGGMSPTSKAKFIKYNCSDCGGDLMAGDGPGTDVTGKWRSMSHNKHWTKQKLAEARATWVRPNDEKTVVTVCTGSRCRKPLLPTAEQLERMQEYSLTIKQESDVRAQGSGAAPRRLHHCRRRLRAAQDGWHVAPRDTCGARRCR